MTTCVQHPAVPARWRIFMIPAGNECGINTTLCQSCFRAWVHPKNIPNAKIDILPSK